jgi:hypothetical protein
MSQSLNSSPSSLAKGLRVGFYLLLPALLGFELLIHKHAAFAIEEWYGFYAGCGLLAALLLALAANYLLRPLLKRNEDYYDH